MSRESALNNWTLAGSMCVKRACDLFALVARIPKDAKSRWKAPCPTCTRRTSNRYELPETDKSVFFSPSTRQNGGPFISPTFSVDILEKLQIPSDSAEPSYPHAISR